MMQLQIGLLLLWWCTVLFAEPTNGSKNSQRQERANRLLEWLISFKDAFVNDKIALRPIDDKENMGLFATQPIQKNETVFIIPHTALLTSRIHTDDTNEEDSHQDDNDDMCYTAWNLALQIQKVQKNKTTPFEHYVRYLFGNDITTTNMTNKHYLPSAWSQDAQLLLKDVLGHELAALLFYGETSETLFGIDFYQNCRHVLDDNKQHAELFQNSKGLLNVAWYTVIARSWNEVMIPVYDMVNHRNGRYHNVDQVTSVHTDNESVVVVALRDIAAGEGLYISYNECHDTDCENTAFSYVLPQILKDYGFVEQYPRRWRFDFLVSDDDEEEEEGPHVVFEVDQQDNNDLIVRWLSSFPNPSSLTMEQTILLRGHLIRQQNIQSDIVQRANEIEEEHEKLTILEFQQALVTALEMVLNYSSPQQPSISMTECTAEKSNDETCQARYYDDLSPNKSDTTNNQDDDDGFSVCSGDHSLYLGDGDYVTIDETVSHYQSIRFDRDFDAQETCLYLSNWLQTCSSFRPHYHEAVVHLPAKYVDTVRRVIYLGGGDNMMLHEILKYNKTLELVMGFELDQQVVRSSFKNMGTQPHFEDDRVQWWFGDATKSLSMLPQHYWGTFDLVIVDLQTNVAETLQVSKDMTIMDAAMRLLKKEGGVLSRNEDFYPRRSVGFAKYEVDIELFDVPVLCQQSITMGSKTVDFLRKEPVDHNIDTVYLNKNEAHLKERQSSGFNFSDWFNYRNNPDHDSSVCQNSKWDEPDGEARDVMGQNRGFHLILEVEDASAWNDSMDAIRDGLRKAIAKAGLHEKTEALTRLDKGYTMFLMQEGYLVLQRWQKEKYFAFDIKLWSNYDVAESLKSVLLDAVGGSSHSSYRIVSGGMSGLPDNDSTVENVPKSFCDEKTNSTAAMAEANALSLAELSILVTLEFMSWTQEDMAAVAAICTHDCMRVKDLAEKNERIIPVRGCASDSLDEMISCEDEILKALQDGTAVKGKLGAIVINADNSKATGQVLHKLLSDKPQRVALLQRTYRVVSVSDDSLATWRSSLIERFQKDFEMFSPAYKSQILFNSTAGTFRLDLFSSGDSEFFSLLQSVLRNIEAKSGIIAEVRSVANGKINYVPDFHPSVVSTSDDYDLADASAQWTSQTPQTKQSIFQFEVQAQLTRLEVGEKVLVEETQDVWKGVWIQGYVVERFDNDLYNVAIEGRDKKLEAPRSALRRFETDSMLEERELVLIRRQGYWSQGAVIEKTTEGSSFRLRMFDTDGDVMIAHRRDLVKRFEASDTSHLPSMSAAALRKAFTRSLASVEIKANDEAVTSFDRVVGAGTIIVASWASGLAIATWDGQSHIEVNLFNDDNTNRNLFKDFAQIDMDEAPSLLLTSKDEMPRGFGRVVNFPDDLEDDPHWVYEGFGKDDEEEGYM